MIVRYPPGRRLPISESERGAPPVSGVGLLQAAVRLDQFGTARNDAAEAAAADASGVYVGGFVGSTSAAPGVTAGDAAGFVRRYDGAGTLLWAAAVSTAGEDRVVGVAAWDGAVYAAGRTDGALLGQASLGAYDAFLREYDASGAVAWTRQFGTPAGDLPLAAAAGASGVYVVGSTFGTFPGETPSALGDVFVRKYDHAGHLLWTDQFGTESGDLAHGVATDATGVYVTGQTAGSLPGESGAGGVGGIDAFVTRLARSTPEEQITDLAADIGDLATAGALITELGG